MITVEAVRGEEDCDRLEPNEIIRFLNARYISPGEACMRLLDYPVQGKTHAINQLPIHLEGEQIVTFRENDEVNQVLDCGRLTMLTAFFEVCTSGESDNQVAKTLTYQNVRKLFRWE